MLLTCHALAHTMCLRTMPVNAVHGYFIHALLALFVVNVLLFKPVALQRAVPARRSSP